MFALLPIFFFFNPGLHTFTPPTPVSGRYGVYVGADIALRQAEMSVKWRISERLAMIR